MHEKYADMLMNRAKRWRICAKIVHNRKKVAENCRATVIRSYNNRNYMRAVLGIDFKIGRESVKTAKDL